MRVLIAGASGAIGLPLVRRLSGSGHQVFGLVRSSNGAARVAQQGGTPLTADVLDFDDVARAVGRARPEVVVEQLTALPRRYTPEAMRETLERTTRVRVVGGANVQRAALDAGANRFVAQSGCYYYRPGEGLADEREPFVPDGPPLVAANVRAFQAVEDRVLNLPDDRSGLVLRYGFFYGPGTWYTREGDMGRQARSGGLHVLGAGTGVWSFVHVEDAADVTAFAAVSSEVQGAVNVTDDTPSPVREWMPAFAGYAGAAAPVPVSIDDAADPDAVFYATAMRGAGNRRAKELLNFRPRPLEWLAHSPSSGAGAAPAVSGERR